MATLDEIAEAIQSIELKKQSLNRAFDDLQKQSNSFSSFSLSWPEIDSHFSQIQSSLHSRFLLLQKNEQSEPKSEQHPVPQTQPNPEFMSFCEKMDEIEVRDWVEKNCKLKDGRSIELRQALKSAPNPAKLVLDVIEGVPKKGKTVAILLEVLMMIEGVDISREMKERAKKLGLKWKEEVNKEGKFSLEIVGLLYFLGCFRLVEEIGKDDVFELVCIVGHHPRTVNLCRFLGLEDKVPDLIVKLANHNRIVMALKFVHEYKLVSKFPPQGLLKSYLKRGKKAAQKLRKKKIVPGALDLADEKELTSLKTVLKCIEEHNLESKYPPDMIEPRIKQLEEIQAIKKASVPSQPPKPNQPKAPKKVLEKKTNQPPVNKKTVVSNAKPGPVLGSSSQQGYMQPPVMSMQLHGPGSSVGSYPLLAPILNSTYGIGSSVLGYGNNPGSTGSHPSALGMQLPSNSFNVLRPAEGYGVPLQYPPVYYPK